MRPKIGVALGAGGAHGWAHIGILEGLATLGIAPDIVAGTSIGALVGAAFATGKLPQLKARVENLGKREVGALLDVHLATGGLIQGNRIERFLTELGIEGPIESFACRFGAVATNLASGREVWFQKGPIGRAVRASISVPGIFSPAPDEDGQWLVDGGLVNPVPVSLARALGADVVIAVDLRPAPGSRFVEQSSQEDASQAELEIPSRLPKWLAESVSPILKRVVQGGPSYPSYFDVLSNSLNIMQDRIARARLGGDPPDILLNARLPDFTWLDFHRAKESIAEGHASFERAKNVILHYCPNATPYQPIAKTSR